MQIEVKRQVWASAMQNILVDFHTYDLDRIKQLMDQVLSDELDQSNNLKKWPCCSFWKVPDNQKLLKPAIQLGKKMVPECTNNHFVRCTVDGDFCEEKGNLKIFLSQPYYKSEDNMF